MKSVKKKIWLVGGGSGGPVTPLLGIAAALRTERADLELLFVGSRHGPERVLASDAGLPFKDIPSGKLRRYFSLRNVVDVGIVLWATLVAWVRLGKDCPAVIVSVGSFVAVPVVWAAALRGIPSLIHQQDVRPGLANRLMAPFAKRITVTFAQSVAAFSKGDAKVVRTGNPVRSDIQKGDAVRGRAWAGLASGRPLILSLGGGTGATSLNRSIATLAEHWVATANVFHVTGAGKSIPGPHSPHYSNREFVRQELPDLMAAADLVISRAGMATISELAALRKATILVPLPGTHQEENAKALEEIHAVKVWHQSTGSAMLDEAVQRLLVDKDERQRLGATLNKFHQPDAARRIAQEILAIV